MSGAKDLVSNKAAFHHYAISDRWEAGISLKGSEVKACRMSKIQLVDSYVAIEKGEAFLMKAHISEYAQSGPYFNHETTRKRKLLLHRREIQKLEAAISRKGFSLLPLRFYLKNGRIKVELGLGKGKTKGDKRATLKEKDITRENQAAVRRVRKYDSYDDD